MEQGILSNAFLDENKVIAYLLKLEENHKSGPDCIPAVLLKRCYNFQTNEKNYLQKSFLKKLSDRMSKIITQYCI